MRASPALSLSVALLLAVGSRASGQDHRALEPGRRVRFVAPAVHPGRIDGNVVGSSNDTTVIVVPGRAAPLRVPTAAIGRVEVFEGRSRWQGAGVGARRGALIVGTIALAATLTLDRSDSTGTPPPMAEPVMAGAGSGALYGAIIGALIGADRWTALPRPAVSLHPAPAGRVAIGVTLVR